MLAFQMVDQLKVKRIHRGFQQIGKNSFLKKHDKKCKREIINLVSDEEQ